MASVTEEARKKANLRMLQRTCDRNITDILASSTHVVLYQFAQAAWSKSDVEGSLFLTITKSTPEEGGMGYVVVILNRNSNHNFIMPITPTLNLQHQDPYLICKRTMENGQNLIQGIWFHNPQERVALTHALESIVQSIQTPQLLATQQPQQTPAKASTAPLGMNTTPAAATTPTTFSTPISAMLAAAHQPERQPAATPPVVPQPPSYAAAAAAPNPTANMAATPDERAHLANLLSQTTMAAVAPPPATTPSATEGELPGSGGVALDKRSLQLALLSLIQDDRFLDLLHSQYLRVIKTRTKKGNGP